MLSWENRTRKSPFGAGVIPGDSGVKTLGAGRPAEGGSSELARVLNATSHDAYGMLSIRPIHVDAEVIQSGRWIRSEKKGNEPDEEGRAGGIVPVKV